MQTSARALRLLLISLSVVGLAGCSTPTTVTEASSTARTIGHIKPSAEDTCETQRQVAAQSSRIDTIIAGDERVYRPKPCKSKDGLAPANPSATS